MTHVLVLVNIKNTLFLTDLVKLYNSEEMDPDLCPVSLQNKVQFDIRYYFCRRGGENIHEMTKDTFQLVFDAELQMPYVKKVIDEETKNRKETDKEVVTGFMPQIIDPYTGHPHKLCPVRSFENYIACLNPKTNHLWQQPQKFRPPLSKTIWYKSQPVGHNPLDTFMSHLAKECNLSQHYTNHCIRVTGTSNLMRRFTPKQVMSVTGHQSLQILAIYQRVRSEEKLTMGMSLMFSLFKPDEVAGVRKYIADQLQREEEAKKNENVVALPPPPPVQLPAATPHPEPHAMDPTNNNILSLESALVPYQQNKNETKSEIPEIDDIDWMEFLADNNDDQMLARAATEVENKLALPQNTTNTSNTTIMNKTIPQTTFTNCKFGNIGTLNIHIHKH